MKRRRNTCSRSTGNDLLLPSLLAGEKGGTRIYGMFLDLEKIPTVVQTLAIACNPYKS